MDRASRLLPLVVLAALVPLAPAPAGPRRFPADRPIDVTHLKLECAVDLEAKRVDATVTLDVTTRRPVASLRLDAVDLDVRAAQAFAVPDGTTISRAFFEEEDALVLDLAETLAAGAPVRVVVSYSVTDPDGGLYFRGPTEVEPDVPWQVWSQGETHEARHWIPCVDQPNERHTSEMVVTVASGLQVLSNGRLVEVTDTEDGRTTFHWLQEPGHAPYLMSLVIGTFHVVEETWRGKPVTYWVPPDRAADVERSFSNTTRMLSFFSTSIGVEYPWDGYAQVVVEQFTYGGMENTGATTLTERTLHDARAHLDTSSDGLVAHELAHQWYGDLITCADWAHTWLNEGFATYLEALWDEHDQGADAFAWNMRGKAKSAIEGGKDLPIVHHEYDGPWQQFDARSYPKGAWVLHMLRRRLGDELWWKCVHRYTVDHAHRAVETVDLRRSFEETSGESLGRFFFDWTERPGHPVVDAKIRWLEKDGLLEVDLVQTQKDDAFHLPLAVDIVLEREAEPRRVTRDVAGKRERLLVPLPARPVAVRVDPGSTILWELKEHMDRPLREAQLRNDPDPVARARAAHAFGDSHRDRDRELLVDAYGKEAFWGVRTVIAEALGRSGGDVSRDGLLAALGEEHPKARRAVVEALGRFRDDAQVEAALRRIVVDGDPSYLVEASAISAWAALRPDGARVVLESLLDRDSHRERIREAALEGLALQADPAALGALREWAARGRPREARTAALAGLARLARAGILAEGDVRAVVATLTEALHRDENARVKRAALEALRDLGGEAQPALAALEALRDQDPSERVRERAREAIAKITSGSPAPVELGRLREMIDELRRENDTLKERLDKLEAKR